MHVWEEEQIFHDGDEFFSHLHRSIDQAQATIDFETYIFDRDKLGNQLLDQLMAAARRGVRVRVLLDGFGCAGWTSADLILLSQAGVQAQFFHPLPWQFAHSSAPRFYSLRRAILGLWKLNRRNHRKTCVIDGREAFMGGMNVSARHSRIYSGSKAWRDTSVRVRGEAVARLTQAFELAWAYPKSLSLPWKKAQTLGTESDLIRINVNRKLRRSEYTDLVLRVIGARKRIWITNPYFIPEFSLLRALRFSAWSGIDVQLLVPSKIDVWGLKWAVNAYYFVLLLAGVKVFEYSTGILHAKIILIDDWLKVGSSNLNSRSFHHDLEADVVLSKKESIHSVERQFLLDLESSKEIALAAWRKRSHVEKLMEKVALLFKKWL